MIQGSIALRYREIDMQGIPDARFDLSSVGVWCELVETPRNAVDQSD